MDKAYSSCQRFILTGIKFGYFKTRLRKSAGSFPVGAKEFPSGGQQANSLTYRCRQIVRLRNCIFTWGNRERVAVMQQITKQTLTERIAPDQQREAGIKEKTCPSI